MMELAHFQQAPKGLGMYVYTMCIYSRAVVEHLLHHLMREGDMVLDVLGLDAELLQARRV